MQEEENTIIDQSADTSEAISSSEEPQSTQAETTRLDAAEAIPSSAADPTAGSGGTDEANAADTAADERSTRTLKLNRNGAEHSEDSSAGGSEESAEARDSEPSSTGEEGEGQGGGGRDGEAYELGSPHSAGVQRSDQRAERTRARAGAVHVHVSRL